MRSGGARFPRGVVQLEHVRNGQLLGVPIPDPPRRQACLVGLDVAARGGRARTGAYHLPHPSVVLLRQCTLIR